MARKPRLHIPGGLYHVILRGNGGQDIFFSDIDRLYFESLVGEGIKRFGHRIHAYCWMKNHVHVAIQVGQGPLSKIIQNLSFRYTRYINRKMGHFGHLFQGRYKAILVDAESYLLELVRYIHLNPVRAKLVKRPEDYDWSGHKSYIGKKRESWLTEEWVLGQFSEHSGKAIEGYKDFIAEGIGEEYRREFHYGSAGGRILGGDSFIEEVLKEVEEREYRGITIDRIIEVVCERYEVEEIELRSRSRLRKLTEMRKLLSYIVVEYSDESLTKLSKRLNRDVTTMSRELNEYRERVKMERKVREELEVVLGELGLEEKGKIALQ
ncbi:MAG: transposase [Thermodesulfobacteriota bacterium]